MKQIVFWAFISLTTAGWAQAPAKPEPSKPEPSTAAKPMAEPPAKQAAAGPRIPKPRRWNEDARHCLERPTPTEVIKCAEEYL